jgi:hypothetical protein
MGKNLFEQIADKSNEIRVNPSPESWTKLQAKLAQNEESSKPKLRYLFKQVSIAAAVVLLAVNAYALISFLGTKQSLENTDPIVFMEIPETPNASPNIFPVSNFDQVSIQEGSRNDLMINQSRSSSLMNGRVTYAFNKLVGIWTNDKQDIELNIFNVGSNELFFSLEDTNQSRLILKAKQMGDQIIISDKKGSAFIEQVRDIEYSKSGFMLLGDQNQIEIKQTDKYTIEVLIYDTYNTKTHFYLNRAI